jgi:O-antigen/teichoic acid export membrane protein
MAGPSSHGLRRLFANASQLFVGNVAAAGLTLLSMVVAVRALSTDEFGQLAIVTALGGVASRLASTGSWQLVVKFGSAAIRSEPSAAGKSRLGMILRRTILLDAIAAMAGGFAVFCAAAFIARWFGLGADSEAMIRVQSVVVLAGATGSAVGLLRLLDHFALASLQNPATAAARLVMALLAWWTAAGLWGFVLAWALSLVVGNLLVAAMALQVYFRSPSRQPLSLPATQAADPAAGDEHSDSAAPFQFWQEARLAYLAGLLRMGRELDVLIVGSIVPLSETGFYRLARTIAASLTLLIDAFSQAIFPDLSRLWNEDRREDLVRLVAQSSMLIGGVVTTLVAGFAIIGDSVLQFVAGDQYLPAQWTVVWCLAATATAAFTQPLGPAVVATGGFRQLMRVDVVTTPFYWLTLSLATFGWGIEGAGAAFLVLHVTWGLAALGMLRSTIAPRSSS